MYMRVESLDMVTGDKWTRLHGYPPAQCGTDDRDNVNYTSEKTKLHNDTLNNLILAPDSLWAAWAEVVIYIRGLNILTLTPDSLWVVWADRQALYTLGYPRLT